MNFSMCKFCRTDVMFREYYFPRVFNVYIGTLKKIVVLNVYCDYFLVNIKPVVRLPFDKIGFQKHNLKKKDMLQFKEKPLFLMHTLTLSYKPNNYEIQY